MYCALLRCWMDGLPCPGWIDHSYAPSNLREYLRFTHQSCGFFSVHANIQSSPTPHISRLLLNSRKDILSS
jgi:hypothetical protein